MTTDQDKYQTIATVCKTFCPVCGRITTRDRIFSLVDIATGYAHTLWVCRKCRTVTAEERR